MKTLITTTLVALISTSAVAASSKSSSSMLKDLDSLGSNKAIAQRAKAIDGRNRVRVVQNRTVDRTMRLEMAIAYDTVAGSDSYVDYNNTGLIADLHIIPRFSIGARHYDTRSRFTPEGERRFEDFKNNGGLRPDVDIQQSSTLGVLSFYPLYGKLNFFDRGVTQFDIYVMGGYGQMKLQSGSTPTYMAGGGVGIWWSQHITSRIEARYQTYEDKMLSGSSRDQGMTAVSAAIGFML